MEDDEAMTVHTITNYREMITSLVQQRGGRVVDAPGDNILVEFPSVVDAVKCGVEIQQNLNTKNAQLPENRRMAFRIGINLGDVIEQEGSLYGDGVNIAARLEALADPGGIFISGTVYEHTKNKLELQSEYKGEHTVKNIAHPIKVYRVLLEPSEMAEGHKGKKFTSHRLRWVLLAFGAVLIVGFGAYSILNFFLHPSSSVLNVSEQTQEIKPPDKPSVAVLPFDNMSADPEQEYFSDGLTEDLITDLSKVSGLFVIARNSAFVYKGKAVNIQDVGQELGVRYVLEGSVRKADDTVRITAQLIDASTGGHLWAERYDRDLKDIFSLQDEVVEKIVTALAVTLTEDEQARLKETQTGNLEAYDYAQRGWWYYHQFTKETNEEAQRMFEQAIVLDDQYANAYAGLGFTYYEIWAQLWSPDPKSLDRAYEMATKSLALDDANPTAYTLLSHVYLWRRQHELAITAQERAIALEPNNSLYYRDLAEILIFAGKPDEAIPLVEKAMLLDPHYPVTFPYTLGFAYAMLGYTTSSSENYEKAIEAQKEALSINPNYLASHLILASVYSNVDRNELSRDHLAQALAINPQISLQALRERLPFKDQAMLEDIFDSLHKAGLN
jgi:adenylate cyclase